VVDIFKLKIYQLANFNLRNIIINKKMKHDKIPKSSKFKGLNQKSEVNA
jgi:hypothetical protein